MASLLELPLEIVEQIISVLAEEKPPSAKFLQEQPSNSILECGLHPLKDLSQACHATRQICFSSLFSAVKVNLDYIDDFMDFSERHELSRNTDSILLYIGPVLSPKSKNLGNLIDHVTWFSTVRVIDSVMPSVVTVVFPPSLFATILPYELNLKHQWAFDIQVQVLQLHMPQRPATLIPGKAQRDYLGGARVVDGQPVLPGASAPSIHESQDSSGSVNLAPPKYRQSVAPGARATSYQTRKDERELLNIFQLRPWTHCTFNRGCSIKGYSSYEYFFKQAPSLFNPVHVQNGIRCRGVGDTLDRITSLDYIAVFPINDFMQFCITIRRMKDLKCLRLQLAPTSSNDVLDDPSAVGKAQPQDLWQEFESCYRTVAENLRKLCDVGEMFLETFVSLDYVNPSLCELIDRSAGQELRQWRSDPGGGRWTRVQEPEEIQPQPGPI